MSPAVQSHNRSIASRVGTAALCLSAVGISGRANAAAATNETPPAPTAKDTVSPFAEISLPPPTAALVNSSKTSTNNPPIPESLTWRQITFGARAGITTFLGYLMYSVRITPPQNRKDHLTTRHTEFLSRNEGFFPGNPRVLAIWTVNHLAVIASGCAIAIQKGQGLLGMIVPAVMAAGCYAGYLLAKKYSPARETDRFVTACGYCSWASMALFVSSKFAVTAPFFAALGVSGAVAGATAGIIARTFAITPYTLDFIRDALHPDPKRTFPQLRSQYMWTAGTIFGALAVPLGVAAIVPIGYAVQNVLITAIAIGCQFARARKLRGT